MIAHELVCGTPFARGSAPAHAIAGLPDAAIELVAAMLVEAPAERPACREVQTRAAALADLVPPMLAAPPQLRIRKPRWTPDVVYRELAHHRTAPDPFRTDDDES